MFYDTVFNSYYQLTYQWHRYCIKPKMTITVSSPDEMIASFPHSTIPKISSEPQYESLVAMQDAMKQNYA